MDGLRWLRGRVFRNAALCVLYIATARIGLLLGPIGGVATTVWPPTGISLAALLLLGYELWPGVALGAFFTNLSIGVPAAGAFGIAVGNTLEALIGAIFLNRVGFDRRFGRTRDVLALIGAAVLSTPISATFGVTSSWTASVLKTSDYAYAWQVWWLGDMMGDLIVAPAIMTWSRGFPLGGSIERATEAAALLGFVGAASAVLFFGPASKPYYVSLYILFPPLIWAAIRFGAGGVSAVALLASALAILGTASGRGLFVKPTLTESLLSLQIFMGVASATSLVLAAVVAERDRARREALALNHELEDFNYSIAHDLRAPLRSIDGFRQAALTELGQHPEQARLFLRRIHDSVRRMAAIIEGLLHLSGLERAELVREEVDLSALARQAAVEMSRADPRRRVRFDIEDGLRADGDPAMLAVLVWNLIDNAWKFTSRNPAAVIEVGRLRADDEDAFFVRDNGAGFDMRYSRLLFKPFQRLHERADFPGAGIGLSMVRRIAERHGGRVWAEGRPERGATFFFTLPAKESRAYEPGTHLVGRGRSG